MNRHQFKLFYITEALLSGNKQVLFHYRLSSQKLKATGEPGVRTGRNGHSGNHKVIQNLRQLWQQEFMDLPDQSYLPLADSALLCIPAAPCLPLFLITSDLFLPHLAVQRPKRSILMGSTNNPSSFWSRTSG